MQLPPPIVEYTSIGTQPTDDRGHGGEGSTCALSLPRRGCQWSEPTDEHECKIPHDCHETVTLLS
jgi:hypothetical protein